MIQRSKFWFYCQNLCFLMTKLLVLSSQLVQFLVFKRQNSNFKDQICPNFGFKVKMFQFEGERVVIFGTLNCDWLIKRITTIRWLLTTLMASWLLTVDGGMSRSVLWKRLGLNRAIGEDRPEITSSRRKGESTMYFIKLPPQPHYYAPFNYLDDEDRQHNPQSNDFQKVRPTMITETFFFYFSNTRVHFWSKFGLWKIKIWISMSKIVFFSY